MEEMLYWIIEYCKVLLGYGFLFFLWPMVVFRKYLAGKSVTFRFCFCAVGQVILVNMVVLMLGLLHILNDWVLRVLFYGTFLYSIRELYLLTPERKRKIRYLMNGTFGWKNFLLLERRKLIRRIEEFCKRIGRFYRKHWLEYSLLLVTVVYGVIYFSWGVFHDYSYGFGDMYVHHSWIYALTEGTVFSAGVYPEAMHCVVYSLHTLFGIRIYSCMLFLAGVHIAIILIAAYCFMKEIFQWRFSAIFVMIVYLTLGVVCLDEVFSMSRLQWTLPQEFGFHTIYISALYLLRYLSHDRIGSHEKKTKGYWNEDLLLFVMAVAASITIHFYVTIMAFFLCAAIALYFLNKIFNRKRFLPLVASLMAGVFIAVMPMLGALASGIPFQGSIGWAVNVINGTDTGEGRTQQAQTEITIDTETLEEAVIQEKTDQNTAEDRNTETEHEKTPTTVDYILSVIYSLYNRAKIIVEKAVSLVFEKIKRIYEYAYVTLYKNEQANLIVGATCGTALLCLLHQLITFVIAKKQKKKREKTKYAAEYPAVILASFLFMVLYAAPYIGLPELIAGARLCSNTHLLIIMVVVLPLDMLFAKAEKAASTFVLQCCSMVVAAGLAVVIYATGNYHGYLYFELTRYNAAVSALNRIMEALPQNSYTIVSTTDERYQVIQDGRHEEILSFLNEDKEKKYRIPTEYVFIFLEKQPILYAQTHFFSGPGWLAEEKYQNYCVEQSVCRNITHSEISEDAAAKSIMFFSNKPSKSYSDLESRTILESKLYEWCQKFSKAYPNELKIYYEDTAFICYYFRQNTQNLYDLNLE